MSEADKIEWPATWPAWCIEIAQAMADAESEEQAKSSDVDWGGLNGPKWVQALGLELVKVMTPTVQLGKRETSGPRFLGALLGHQQWLLESENGLPRQMERVIQHAQIVEALLRKRLTPEAYARVIEAGKKTAAVWVERVAMAERVWRRKRVVVARALHVVERQAVTEKAEFHEAYGKALRTGLFDANGNLMVGGLSSTIHIYFLLVVNWQSMKAFPSVTALHLWLCRWLGETQVGSLDRVKGVCKRYKIKLARRGRPRLK